MVSSISRTRLGPITAGAALFTLALGAQTAQAAIMTAPVALQNATATLSQNNAGDDWNVSQTIDGIDSPSNGWAIVSGGTDPQTAVWETAADLSTSSINIQLVQSYLSDHQLGRFRLSTTTDDRSTFADGLSTGGDVTANWTVLENPDITGITGVVFTTLADNSVLVGGALPATAIYELSYNVSLSGVTGIRLEALADASLPTDGPGRFSNGNFVLTEIVVSAAVPVPAALPLLAGGLGLLGLIGARRRG